MIARSHDTAAAPRPLLLRPLAETLALLALATVIGQFLVSRWGNGPVDLLYLPAVMFAAGLYGLWPGLLATAGSACAYNYFFTQPYHTLRVSSPEDLVTIALLTLVALVTSQLAARMRSEARAAQASAAHNAAIAGFARRLMQCADDQQVARAACRDLSRLFDSQAVLAMPGADGPVLSARAPDHAAPTPTDFAAAAWTIESGKASGRGTPGAIGGEWGFFPIWTDAGVIAAVGLARDDGLPLTAIGDSALLGSLLDQLALALDRSRLESEAVTASEHAERNRIRASLLATVSRDIEPLLDGMTGALGKARRDGGDRAALGEVGTEVSRLRTYLANLIDVGSDSDEAPVEAQGVRIDLARRLVTRDGADVKLTPKEYRVLAELAKYPDRVLTHAHLLRAAWGPAQEKQVDYLRVAVRALRQKLERDPANPVLILNEPAVGYRLKA
jgi:two-component system sensor histidine kinase KdpD